uniref:Uncharacterized protein n=1 Tax=Avena sativa TaxID=4498 RepID=A0ACD5ZNU1_AVESA
MNRRDERNDMVGLDDDVKRLEKLLLRKDHPETMFISIIGESGVGKSTLATELFKKLPDVDVAVETKLLAFTEPYSWAEEVVQILYKAYSNIREDSENSGEDTDPVSELRAYFSVRKYMVILGGITSVTMLNLLRLCLPDNRKGSSVVLVLDAENEDVALHADKMNRDGVRRTHLVTRLDEKRSGDLFRYKALRKEVSSSGGNPYDERVFAITRGHPLSIVLLAGLVRFKEEPLQWELVLQQLMPGSASKVGESRDQKITSLQPISTSMERIFWAKVGESGDQRTSSLQSISTSLERIFWASFEDLSNNIKSCFLYFVIVGKNAVVDAREIVRMWIGEGFIRPHKGKTMEEVGDRYMKELALRCLIQVHSRDNSGGIANVKLHSSLHGFLQCEAREDGFVEVHDIHDVFVPPSARRLSFQIYGGRYTTFTSKLPKLRSFISMGNGDTDHEARFDSTGAEKLFYDLKFLLGSKFLRVIVLGGERVKELPKAIGKLLELRYLCVKSQELKVLPSSIKRLFKLQTLDIKATGVQRVDPGFWKIKTLRHVIASNLALPAVSLEEELSELQTLVGVTPPQGQTWSHHSCPLHKMSKLRILWLERIQHEYHRSALECALQEMHLIVSVTLQGDLLPSSVFTAKNLRFLEEIRLQGRVDWPRGALNARMLRPNLRQTAVDSTEPMPPHIIEELQW